MAVTRITSRNIKDFTIQLVDLRDLAVAAGVGLNADYQPGRIRVNAAVVDVVAGSVALADDALNFIEVDAAGVVSANIVGFTLGRIPMATVTTAAGVVTAVADKRTWLKVDHQEVSTHVENETPAGTINGVNAVFTLADTPNPASSLRLHLNGLRMRPGAGNDYVLVGDTITFETEQIPQTDDILLADYRF